MAETKATPRVPVSIQSLGPLAKQVPQSFYFPLAFWVCVIACLAVFGVIVALWVGLIGPRGPDANFEQFRLVFTLVGGPVAVLFFGGLGYFCWLQMNKRVWVSPVGFAWVTPGRTELFPWDQVKRVKFPLHIEREDGYKVNLSQHVDGMDSALPFEEFWVPLRLAKVREQIEQGEEVKFGAFQVSRKGVTKSGETLPWEYLDRIVRITGQMNAVQLFMKGRTLPWCTVGLNSVPNHLVFQRLVVDMVNETRRHGA